jgi:hypothetical protein
LRTSEIHQIGESAALRRASRWRYRSVENDGTGDAPARLSCGNDRQCRIELDVPVAALHASAAAGKRWRARSGSLTPAVDRLSGCPETQFGEPVELGIRCLVVDDRDAARILAARLHAEDRCELSVP